MSGGQGADFFDELKDENSYLAVTFYTALGIVLVLLIIIVLLLIGFCCLARFIIKRKTGSGKDSESLASQSQERLELKERENDTENGSDILRNNTHKEGSEELGEQESGKIDSGSKEKTPLLHRDESRRTCENKQTPSTKQAIEEMYATVNKTNEPGSGKKDNTCLAVDVETTGAPTLTVGEDDYAEVQCQPPPDDVTTKPRSQTIHYSAAVVMEPENEDYSRLVHVTQPNPRLSMPLLAEYDRIDLSGIKRLSLGKDLDQDVKGDPVKSSDYEMMTDPQKGKSATPPLLPTPVTDDIIEIKFGSNEGDSTPLLEKGSGSKHKRELEIMSDPLNVGSPPPLPPPFLGEEEQENEVLYDNAPIILQNSQNLSNNNDTSGESDKSHGEENQAEQNEQSKATEHTMNPMDISDGIYENIGKGVR